MYIVCVLSLNFPEMHTITEQTDSLAKVSVSQGKRFSQRLVQLLTSKVRSPLLLRDLHLYEAAIRANIREDFFKPNEGDLDAKVTADILAMDEWLTSAGVGEEVWSIVLEKTQAGYVLTSVDPDNVPHPDSLIFMAANGEEIVAAVTYT